MKLSAGFGIENRAVSMPQINRHVSPLMSAANRKENGDNHSHEGLSEGVTLSRRSVLAKSSVFIAATTRISSAQAAEGTPQEIREKEAASGMVSTKIVADRLRVVPTFTIVDPKGVPYMVVGEDAKVTGYFFTTYDEANRLLTLARTSADDNIRDALNELRAQRKRDKLPPLSKQEQDDAVGVNPWKSARISTVPLDVAVTLVTKSMYSRKTGGGNYFQVAPAESDVEDALALDKSGKEELAEGRVPLFYFPDFEINDGGGKQSPLYFRKSELLADWKRQNPSADVPQVLVTEMFSVLTEMVKPGGTDEDLRTLVFVPPKESTQKAKDCIKAGGKEPQFIVGQRIVVL